MPYQQWKPFPDDAMVEVKNIYGDSRTGVVSSFWWGYEDNNLEGTIYHCRLTESSEQPKKEPEIKKQQISEKPKTYKIEFIFTQNFFALCYLSSEIQNGIIKVFPHVQGIFETYEDAAKVRKSMTLPENYYIVPSYKARAIEDK